MGTTGPVEPRRPAGPAAHGRPRRPAHPTGPAAGRSGLTVSPGHPLVGPSDQPVPAGHHEPGRGEGDLPQLRMTARVLPPEPADDVHRLAGRGGELQAGDRRAHMRRGPGPASRACPSRRVKTSAIRAGVVPRGCWPRSQRVTDVLSYRRSRPCSRPSWSTRRARPAFENPASVMSEASWRLGVRCGGRSDISCTVSCLRGRAGSPYGTARI